MPGHLFVKPSSSSCGIGEVDLEIVGHVPHETSQIIWYFIEHVGISPVSLEDEELHW